MLYSAPTRRGRYHGELTTRPANPLRRMRAKLALDQEENEDTPSYKVVVNQMAAAEQQA